MFESDFILSLAAIALQLLLKLKRHLKIVYSLKDARCQVYICLLIGIYSQRRHKAIQLAHHVLFWKLVFQSK